MEKSKTTEQYTFGADEKETLQKEKEELQLLLK